MFAAILCIVSFFLGMFMQWMIGIRLQLRNDLNNLREAQEIESQPSPFCSEVKRGVVGIKGRTKLRLVKPTKSFDSV